jgi:ferrochelatase
MATSKTALTGVLLMTYGSATNSKNVEEFLDHVYPDGPDSELVTEFKRRFDIVNGSPLVAITVDQGKELQKLLDREHPEKYVVKVGMLHSTPFIKDAIADLKASGAKKIIGIILSPQFSDFIMGGYKRHLLAATKQLGFKNSDVLVVGPWPNEPSFIELISKRLLEKHQVLVKKYGTKVPIIFTTHSLPERVVAKDPNYLKQLEKTMKAVVKKAKLDDDNWTYAYQSAGHTPEPWLKPDLVDILAKLRPEKVPAVLIVPLQFLADHLEILYDLDTAAAEQCTDYGTEYNRIELPNTDPLFINSLSHLVTNNSVLI